MRLLAVVFACIAAFAVHAMFRYPMWSNPFFAIGAVAIFFALFAINCWRKNSNDRAGDNPLWTWFDLWRWWR
jgi:uncharacterized membrane protein